MNLNTVSLLRRASSSFYYSPASSFGNARRFVTHTLFPSAPLASENIEKFVNENINYQKDYKNHYNDNKDNRNNGYRSATFLFSTAATAIFSSSILLAKEESSTGSKAVNYQSVRERIAAIIEEDAPMGPTFVRLAWHASGTYCKVENSGGSHGGCIRFNPEASYGANAGLHIARDALEKVKAENPNITYADLYTLAGVVAIEEMGGPSVKWEPGRSDFSSGGAPDGRLPDADKGEIVATISHIRSIFYRMGFDDSEIVALIGAHALGRCYPSRSGYSGPWTRAEFTFSNEYFRELLESKWTVKKWAGPTQFEDETGDLMMLPTDMAMIWDKSFRVYVEAYAKDQDKYFEDFANACSKLFELGVPRKAWYQFW